MWAQEKNNDREKIDSDVRINLVMIRTPITATKNQSLRFAREMCAEISDPQPGNRSRVGSFPLRGAIDIHPQMKINDRDDH
jgi:hypothetical protein